MPPSIPNISALRRRLLAWYDHERRSLPWRSPPSGVPDPYRVWVSEIMLQQTTVVAAKAYFDAFVSRWPTVKDLAAADLDAVLHAWQGLGYYARARHLHACARVVAESHGGHFPDSEETLRRLPGIGAYTAAAIASIAFGRKATPVDGNVIRVVARLHGVEAPLPRARARIEALARALTPDDRPGDFAQAVMDLGATICTPRQPCCVLCPWRESCSAFATGRPEAYPVKAEKRPKPTRSGVAFWVERDDGAVLLRRRPDRGLLGGMMEIPSTEWRDRPWALDEALAAAPVRALWQRLEGAVNHIFSHFHLKLMVVTGRPVDGDPTGGVWCPVERLDQHALPTVMKKVVRHALAAGRESGC